MMDVNAQDLAQGAQAFKTVFDIIKETIGLIRHNKNGTPDENKAVEIALLEAEKASKIAEIQLAKALGYELCHCQFPPTAMLTVGRGNGRGMPHSDKQIYECPKCGFNTAGGWSYTRIAPPFIKEEA